MMSCISWRSCKVSGRFLQSRDIVTYIDPRDDKKTFTFQLAPNDCRSITIAAVSENDCNLYIRECLEENWSLLRQSAYLPSS